MTDEALFLALAEAYGLKYNAYTDGSGVTTIQVPDGDKCFTYIFDEVGNLDKENSNRPNTFL